MLAKIKSILAKIFAFWVKKPRPSPVHLATDEKKLVSTENNLVIIK
jgi:hypothetical protein